MLCTKCPCALPGWVTDISVNSPLSPLSLGPCNMTVRSMSLSPSPFILPALRLVLTNTRQQKQNYTNFPLVYGDQEYPSTHSLMIAYTSWKTNTETRGSISTMILSSRQPQTWHMSKPANEKRPWEPLLKSLSLLQNIRPAEWQNWARALRR